MTRANVEVDETELCVALPLDYASTATLNSQPPQQQVFAFLPLRSYGLRVVVQGDFIVPSSRESIDWDSSW